MSARRIRSATVVAWIVIGFVISSPSVGRAQIQVEGIDDETVYTDRTSFRVVVEGGWTYSATLNGAPVTAGESVAVEDANYYRLDVERTNDSSGAVERLGVQFIVRASARGNSEWGLRPFVPLPPTPSAAAEFAGASLALVAPARFPRGLEIPLVAWVRDAAGARVGVLGELRAPEFPAHPLRLLRGVGSTLLPAASAAGTLRFATSLHGLEEIATIDVEDTTTWTAVAGTIAASTDWGEDARVDVTGDLTIAAGATLSVGAGTVVRLAPGAEIEVAGTLRVNGTVAAPSPRPVVFSPRSRATPWGGINFRSAASRGEFRGAILTGSGADDDWFDNNADSGSSHRDEQPCLYVSNGATVELFDCYLIDNVGQAGHGESSFLEMTRCLVQRCITAGQYNRGAIRLTDCALVEFPALDAPFADDDNDGFYLTGGAHVLVDTMIGWALDDGIDAGSGSAGTVSVTGCWFESCYHEGMAWSEDREPTVRDTVATNCGQGLECGFGTPQVDALRVLSTGNLIGARFGDNYDWDYDGFLSLHDSLILFNERDVFGRNWNDWTVRSDQIDVTTNLVSALDPDYPGNTLWDPARDAAALEPFLPAPATAVGVAWATWSDEIDLGELRRGVPARLSTFTTHPVSVDWSLDVADGPLTSGTLELVAGDTVESVALDLDPEAAVVGSRLLLTGARGADITGRRELRIVAEATWIEPGSNWNYDDRGVDLGVAWRMHDFDDAAWASGPAELGFGDDDEATVVEGGPDDARYPTIYFRRAFDVADPAAVLSLALELLRDDGALVWLNGVEVFRSNLPAGAVTFATLASSSQSGSAEEFFQRAAVDPSLLVAGRNVVAVEVHQVNATSSDVSFDFALAARLAGGSAPSTPRFRRGDSNQDGRPDVSDVIDALLVLFAGGTTNCVAALDTDGSGVVDLTDPVALANYLFRGGNAPPEPFAACGRDAGAVDLGCESFAGCP